ncbi:SDR family NAD(P)-dependent oxidoreductase, partial [Bacillus paralicheniformis]|uniref:SDR family NAD(P)-dependent oxidoreductase n=1 Tax=Bacillus paralicheniformis TaxID=1648923 RepID=UPI002849E4E6
TVLVTGGASGIGFAFAERFMKSGNTVIVCGRRESKLKEAKEKYPELITRICDVTDETERLALFEWVKERHAGVNVLVNNAGRQQRYHILKADVIDNWA